jgi:hypothetical protein
MSSNMSAAWSIILSFKILHGYYVKVRLKFFFLLVLRICDIFLNI